MISEARNISQSLNRLINTHDSVFVLQTKSVQEEFKTLGKQLRSIFEADASGLRRKTNLYGFGNDYAKLESNWNYMASQAFLRKSQIAKSTREKFICVVARVLICRRVALSHIEKINRLLKELQASSRFLLDLTRVEISKIDEVLKLAKRIDSIKGYSREANSSIDDYCHFLDLAYHILGDVPELFGTRLRADVYTFQIDTAIRELFTSRTESCDAAPFLIRSRLEINLRRILFGNDLTSEAYVPTPHLSSTELLKSCKRAGIDFTCPTDLLERVIENLNIVVHLGLQLTSSMMWYSYFIAINLKIIADGSTEQERKGNLKNKMLDLYQDLEHRSLVQKAQAVQYFDRDGINILWRY